MTRIRSNTNTEWYFSGNAHSRHENGVEIADLKYNVLYEINFQNMKNQI